MINKDNQKEGDDLNPLSCNKKGLTIQDLIKMQIKESEEETKQYSQEEVNEDISNLLAKQKQKEKGFKLK